MLIVIPFGIYILTVIAVIILQQTKKGTGVIWLTVAVSSLVVWGVLIVLQRFLPLETGLSHLRPFSGVGEDAVLFRLDERTFPFVFSLAGLLAAVMITASVRLKNTNPVVAWAGNILLTMAGMTAVMADSISALALAWTMLDAIELILVLILLDGSSISRQAIFSFMTRIIGTLVLITGYLINPSPGGESMFSVLSAPSVAWIFFALLVRLGIYPFSLQYYNEIPSRRGIGTMFRIAAPVSALGVLAHLPAQELPLEYAGLVKTALILAILYGAVRWVYARNALKGLPYWVIVFAGFSFISALNGQAKLTLVWTSVMVLSGGILTLFSLRWRLGYIFPLLGLVGIVGFPFTPAHAGMAGIFSLPVDFGELILIACLGMVVAGSVLICLQPGDRMDEQERWVLAVYPLGLGIPLISEWLLTIWFWKSSFSPENWLPGVILLLGAALLIVLFWLFRKKVRPEASRWFELVTDRVLGGLGSLFSFHWLLDLIRWGYRVFSRVFVLATILLEGDGGLLWVFVLLALMVTLISVGGLG